MSVDAEKIDGQMSQEKKSSNQKIWKSFEDVDGGNDKRGSRDKTEKVQTKEIMEEDRSVSDNNSESEDSQVEELDDRDMTWREILWSGLVDYGPPYLPPREDQAEYELVGECSIHNSRLWKVHLLLNQKIDPNSRDPEDLYYSAGHWCVRNCHYPHLKLLFKAGLDLNILNELGESMLGMACLMKYAEDKFYDNIRIIRFLIENGADINHRDKAGYTPLDFTTMNNNKEIIQLLLANGANVERNNTILVAKRIELLDHVKDPDTYHLLNSKVKIVKELRAAHRYKNDEILRIIGEKQRIKDQIEKFELKRMLKRAKKQRQAGENFYREQVEKIAREDRIEMNEFLGRYSGDSNYKYGSWVRDNFGKWHWESSETKKSLKDICKEGEERFSKIKDKYSYKLYNDRWKELTDGSELEMTWVKSNPFDQLNEESGSLQIEGEKYTVELGPSSSNEVDFRDENDEMLADMDDDFDDLMNKFRGY